MGNNGGRLFISEQKTIKRERRKGEGIAVNLSKFGDQRGKGLNWAVCKLLACQLIGGG